MTIFHIETPAQRGKNGYTVRYSVLADTDKIIKVRKTEYDSSGNVSGIKENKCLRLYFRKITSLLQRRINSDPRP